MCAQVLNARWLYLEWLVGRASRRAGGEGVLSHAEAKCARAEGVGLPERSEPEGTQGAARGGEEEMEVVFCCFSEYDATVYEKFLP